MTLEEINALILDDYKDLIESRLQSKIILEEGEEYPEFSDEAFADEFAEYKAELITAENERLRQLDLKNRFYGGDYRAAFHTLHPDKANPAIFIRDLMKADPTEAEAAVTAMETKRAELLATPDAIKRNWEVELRDALAGEKITESGLLEALVRKEFFNDSSRIDALKDKMTAINTAHPRPAE